MSKKSLVEKYRPKSLSDIAGNNKNVKKIKKWGENWDQGSKPLLIHGKAGTGKTSACESLANDMGWSLEEINASSALSKDNVKYIVQSIRSTSMDGNKVLFLFDEADSITGRSLNPLKQILLKSKNPIVFTANEKWKVPDGIENKCKSLKFKLQKRSIKPVIRKIAKEEGIDISPRDIGKLSTRNGLRDAINDLQEYAGSTGQIEWDNRDTDIGNFKAVDNILKGKKFSGEMTPPDMIEWLDENIYGTMEGVEAMRAMQCLSEADKFVQMANETQNYSWWKYAGSISEEVANVRITEPYDWIQKNYPKARRNRPKKSHYQNNEAQLYRELKDSDSGPFFFSFQEFRKIILPQMKNSKKEDIKSFCLTHNLSNSSRKELGISKNEYESWLMEEKEDKVKENLKTTDTQETAKKSLFDY